MRNILKKIVAMPKQLIAGLVIAGIVAVPTAAQALSFTGTYTGNGAPQFNIYDNVDDALFKGDESDFLQVKPAASGNYTNSLTACEGEFRLMVYIHNGAPEGYNEEEFNGSGIAEDAKVRVQLPVGTASTFTSTATISASNAVPASISDTATIVCDDGEATLSYVPGSAELYNAALGTVSLPDTLVNGGTALGYDELNGLLPGCWQYRNWVFLKVKLVKKEKPVVEPDYSCDLTTIKQDGRKVTINDIDYTAKDGATFKRVRVDWGDGKVEEFTSTSGMSHTYAANVKNATITTSVIVEVDGKEQVATDADCVKKVSFVAPELPRTGPGSTIALFTVVTLAAAAAHNVISRRVNA